MEKGVIEFGKSLLEPIAEDREDFITPLEQKLDAELNYSLLTVAEKIEILEKIIKELQDTQAVKDFADICNDPRHQERIRSIQARTKDLNIVAHHLHKANTEVHTFRNLKLHRFKFDVERLYVYNGENIFLVPCTHIKRFIGTNSEDFNTFIDKVESESKDPPYSNTINDLELFNKYLQKNFRTYAELYAKNKDINTRKETTFDKLKADFLAIVNVLDSNVHFTSAVRYDL